MQINILIPNIIIFENKLAILTLINANIINKNPVITIGPTTILKIKFDIKKYGLTVFKFDNNIGIIAN